MAISVAWQTTATVTAATTNTFYTVPASTAASFAYARDMVINNSGPSTLFVCLTPSGSAGATSLASFAIPTGGTMVLTQCAAPSSAVVGIAVAGSGTATANLGYATNVSYV